MKLNILDKGKTLFAIVFMIMVSSYHVYGFLDMPQKGDKETIGMNIEKQEASNNRIEKDAIKNELNVKEGAFQGNIEVLKEYNSPIVQTDRISVTAYQNQSSKLITKEEESTYYATGAEKSHRVTTSEPIPEKEGSGGLLSNFNFPSWLNTLILILIGGGLLNKNYDIIGKFIKVIKWLWNKIREYWRKK